MDLYNKLENTHCMLYFDNFFNSPTLFDKLFDRAIYCLGTIRNDPKIMTIMKKERSMKRGYIDFRYSNNVIALK